MIFKRGLLIWVLIIFAESLHGTARMILLEPYMGEVRARQIAVFTGMAIILIIATLSVRWIRARSNWSLVFVGVMWVVLTFAFEILLGRFVLAYSWKRIFADYDLRDGGLMLLGMVFLLLAPLLAARVRELLGQDQSLETHHS